jgi:prepilin-type N-terminal cleavage/methylation domain-containing protein
MIYNRVNNKGFSLLELVLAIAIFSLAAFSTGYLIIDATRTTDANTKKIQGSMLAIEGIKAVRSIRDTNGFAELTSNVGDNGLSFTNGVWSFDGTFDTSTDGIYTRIITIGTTDDSNIIIATSTVSAESGGRTIATTLVTEFTNWQIE